ncbi:hypothetical protein [Cohnella kolymensis]|uniref:hypothetical protein n=1 Tax=Cohnella kolymensis TaxID=1590652 RepID=UPI0013792E65|nr:hypothetical protein [Cohnella kolymensis]
MEHEKEIQELKERLASVERQLQRKSQTSGLLNFILGFFIVLILLSISIGVVQFIT